MKTFVLYLSVCLLLAGTACNPSRNAAAKLYHSSYDDTTLMQAGPMLLPYNRFIDPAGNTVRFGNPALENHSLDCCLLPGGNVLAVEDRYGVAFINVKAQKMVFHYDYGNGKEKKELMSTYCGIKAISIDGETHIFWSATNPDNNFSEVIDATWDGNKAVTSQTFEFKPVAPAPMALPNDIALNYEKDGIYMYVVCNGNNQLTKISLRNKAVIWTTNTGMAPFGIAIAAGKAYVTNWAGPVTGGYSPRNCRHTLWRRLY